MPFRFGIGRKIPQKMPPIQARRNLVLTEDVKEYGLKKGEVVVRTGEGEHEGSHCIEWFCGADWQGRPILRQGWLKRSEAK